MRIMLICTAGMSTSLLMDKIEKYIDEHKLPHKLSALSLHEYDEYFDMFDVILLAPQISYKLSYIQEQSALPTAVIPTMDYAVGNVEHILIQVDRLLGQ